mmetsp:Transcript_36066/g.84761  ORF Transcript_36066/g.84761 Transcript_36066/m.84761 type:complete len:202 (+) Transcript_36066:324-929(+)
MFDARARAPVLLPHPSRPPPRPDVQRDRRPDLHRPRPPSQSSGRAPTDPVWRRSGVVYGPTRQLQQHHGGGSGGADLPQPQHPPLQTRLPLRSEAHDPVRAGLQPHRAPPRPAPPPWPRRRPFRPLRGGVAPRLGRLSAETVPHRPLPPLPLLVALAALAPLRPPRSRSQPAPLLRASPCRTGRVGLPTHDGGSGGLYARH